MAGRDTYDPNGVIAEAFAMEGLTKADCRSIFLDWVLSLGPEMRPEDGVSVLLSRHAAAPPGHPMVEVLKEALAAPPRRGRRGGSAGRFS
ncbi:hypothetical protein LX81_01157 [Palleronia aestuarii]|uniref:Uncharacterized protein n=1 Tax=Palleronia aestuarii TaxID=568105 RepID=A0A2W7NGB1_9RHOB|nr:hypothetical protein [Palleronia aestuarii]PZX18523.1 hypothetical protein LX81_01157 [Palleronia aestuarii]